MKPIKKDWITFVCFILIIISTSYVVYYFVLEKVDTCTSDPLKFAVEKIKYTTDAKLVSGNLIILTRNGMTIRHEFGDNFFYSNNKTFNFSK